MNGFLFTHSFFNISPQGYQCLHWVGDLNLKTWCKAPVSQVMNSKLKLKINIPQCYSWMSQNYTYQSTASCTFSPCFVYRICLLNYEVGKPLLDKQLLVKSELDCRYCKIEKQETTQMWNYEKETVKNVKAFESRQTDGGKKNTILQICISEWLINFCWMICSSLVRYQFPLLLHFYRRSQETASSKDGSI